LKFEIIICIDKFIEPMGLDFGDNNSK